MIKSGCDCWGLWGWLTREYFERIEKTKCVFDGAFFDWSFIFPRGLNSAPLGAGGAFHCRGNEYITPGFSDGQGNLR